MRTAFLSFTFIVASVIANAQILIQGKVMDAASELPIANASVYLNNTSVGTVTDAKGMFVLNAKSFFSGELIVSSIGYQPLYFKLDNKDADRNLYIFKLEIKESILKNVLIMNDAVRQNWLRIFKENFLGITEEADNCTIENPGAISFAVGENKNSMYAYSDSPLIVINKLLGYKISFDLVEFSYDNTKNSTYFLGYARYEELGDKRSWLKRRKQNYFGSTMHFYQSLTANNLKSEGFSIFDIQVKDKPVKDKKGPTAASEKISVAVPIAANAILVTDTVQGKYYLKTRDQVMIQYNETPHSKFYLSRKIMVRGLNRFGFTAYISLLADQVELDKNGIIRSPLAIIYDGFWVYEKLANQLPFDYRPN